MNHKRKLLALVCFASVVVLLPTFAAAKDQPTAGLFANLCEGETTCGEFITEPQNQGMRMEWVLGYFSGANSRALPPYKMVGQSFDKPGAVLGWLQSYCSTNSLNVLANAAEVLRQDFIAHEQPVRP
jgi:hypothetical protein